MVSCQVPIFLAEDTAYMMIQPPWKFPRFVKESGSDTYHSW